MGVYDTQTLRKYCENHKGDILDVGYLLSTSFRMVKPGSFRKYVSRLVEEGILFPLDKGIYTIGEIPEKKINDVLYEHYTAMGMGIGRNNTLLWKFGLDKKPDHIFVFSSVTNGNRNIGNFHVTEYPGFLLTPLTSIVIMMELNNVLRKGVDEQNMEVFMVLKNYVDKYSDDYLPNINDPIYKLYPRIDFISLANLLNRFHISNRVMERYEEYSAIYDSK